MHKMKNQLSNGNMHVADVNSINSRQIICQTFYNCDLKPFLYVIFLSEAINVSRKINKDAPPFIIPNEFKDLSQQECDSICNELPLIINFTHKNCFLHINSLASSIMQLLDYNKKSLKQLSIIQRERLNKIAPSYNKALNLFRQSIITTESESVDTHILEKRKLLKSLCMFCHNWSNLVFKKNIDTQKKEIIKKSGRELINFKRSNYDGISINNMHQVIFTVNESIKRTTQHKYIGVGFGFDNREDFFQLLKMCIKDALPNQLVFKQQTQKPPPKIGEYSLEGNRNYYVFTLKLLLEHEKSYCYIDTNSKKIFHWLINGNNPTDYCIKTFLENPKEVSLETRFKIGFCVDFHELVINKIKNLIGTINYPDFPFVTYDCYRPSCQHVTIKRKLVSSTIPSKIICDDCKISEFCSGCGLLYHGTSQCNVSFDEASIAFIQNETIPCPNCSVRLLKDGGCNHMTCKQCRTEFCWLCHTIYTHNEINSHYINMNSSGRCYGLINTPEDRRWGLEDENDFSEDENDISEDDDFLEEEAHRRYLIRRRGINRRRRRAQSNNLNNVRTNLEEQFENVINHNQDLN